MADDTPKPDAKTENLAELVQIYGIMVDTITANEHRRQQTMTAFITLITGSFAIIGFLRDTDPIFPVLVAVALAAIWRQKILFHQDVAKAKWQACLQLEARFPVQVFSDEYATLQALRKKRNTAPGRLTDLEALLPLAIIFCGLFYALVRVYLHLSSTGQA